jgi:photosystem II stability/assembly factor-like uncharacterized protein
MNNLRGIASVALVLALLLSAGPIQGALAAQQDGSVVSLAYDPGANALLKTYARAIYRSSDRGKTWQKIVIPPFEDGRLSSLAVSPAGKGIMYAAGPGFGVLRTDNGGKTWVDRNVGLPSRDVIAVAAHTTQPDTVYAVIKGQGFYRSQDAGRTWRLMDRTSQQGLRQLIHSNMPGSMQTGWLFAATAKGVRRAMDCFCLWQDAGKLGSPAHSIAYDPKEPKHLYTATEKGLFRSTDGGESWVAMKSPSSNVSALVFTNSGVLFAINADGELFQSQDQGGTWINVNV